MKLIHYPDSMGLRPRPADDYDLLCLRFYRASVACNVRRAMDAARDLVARYGSDVADDAFSHGQMLDSCVIR